MIRLPQLVSVRLLGILLDRTLTEILTRLQQVYVWTIKHAPATNTQPNSTGSIQAPLRCLAGLPRGRVVRGANVA